MSGCRNYEKDIWPIIEAIVRKYNNFHGNGFFVGFFVGDVVGFIVGFSVGFIVGFSVGFKVGFKVGADVELFDISNGSSISVLCLIDDN